MATTAPPSAPTAPTVPVRSDRSGFPIAMYNFFLYMVGSFTTWLTDSLTNVYDNANDAYASATAAATSETNAAASATAAATSGNAALWVSGTTYTLGTCVFSPVNYQTYRRIVAGGGTTDPSADTTNWLLISALGLPMVTVSGTTQTASAFKHYVLTNAAASTLTLPAAPADGDVVSVTVGNARLDNIVARNGKSIEGVAEDMTIDVTVTLTLKYISATLMWRLV